jgi:hypothetical protein
LIVVSPRIGADELATIMSVACSQLATILESLTLTLPADLRRQRSSARWNVAS